MTGKTDAAPPPLWVKKKGKLSQGNGGQVWRKIKVWFVFMSKRQPYPPSKIPTAKAIKKMVMVSPFFCVVVTSQVRGGVTDFHFEVKKEDVLSVSAADFCSLACQRRQNLRLSPLLEWQRPQAGSPSGLTPTCLWCCCIIRSLRPSLRHLCRPSRLGRPPCHLTPPLPPSSYRLGIIHGVIIRHWNVLTMRQRQQSIPTLFPTLSTSTFKILVYSGSLWWYMAKMKWLRK